jgi:hypothetical protein
MSIICTLTGMICDISLVVYAPVTILYTCQVAKRLLGLGIGYLDNTKVSSPEP